MRLVEVDEARIDPSLDERYTAEYIEREASLILRYIGHKNRRVFRDLPTTVVGMDKRILRRWGLR
jgi:hypothetical protein